MVTLVRDGENSHDGSCHRSLLSAVLVSHVLHAPIRPTPIQKKVVSKPETCLPTLTELTERQPVRPANTQELHVLPARRNFPSDQLREYASRRPSRATGFQDGRL